MKEINKRVFLDYASTTPVRKEVLKAMKPYFMEKFANPSALYKEGLEAKTAVETSREKVAKTTGVKPNEVIFTGSGTESDNMAVMGSVLAVKNNNNKIFESWSEKNLEIITTKIEHPAVMEACREVERSNLAKVNYLSVQENGKVNISNFKKDLNENTFLVSIILANNEIGTIQSIRKISGEIRKYKNKIGRSSKEPPFLHTDASQAPLYMEINLDKLGAHMITLDASKIGGPKGVGCLVKKNYVPMTKILFGGGQEFGLRPATENVPAIVGFAKALEIAEKNREQATNKTKILQKYFFEKIKEKFPRAKINGETKDRLPNNINVCFPGLNSEFAVIQLDEKGVACSAMTACKNTSEDARSYVVDALGRECGKSSLRFTFNEKTKKKDIDFAIRALSDIM